MVDFGMSPQAALDAPRFCIGPGHTGAEGAVEMEDGISAETCETLRTSFGHEIAAKSPVTGTATSTLFLDYFSGIFLALYHPTQVVWSTRFQYACLVRADWRLQSDVDAIPWIQGTTGRSLAAGRSSPGTRSPGCSRPGATPVATAARWDGDTGACLS